MTYTEFLELVGSEVRGRDWNDHIGDQRKRDIAYSAIVSVGANADLSRLESSESALTPEPVNGYLETQKADLPADLFHYREDNGIISVEFDEGIVKYPHLHNRSLHSLRALEQNEYYSDQPMMNLDSQGRILYFINSESATLHHVKLFAEPTEVNASSLDVPLVAGDIQQAVQVVAIYLKSLDIRDATAASTHAMIGRMLSVQRNQAVGENQ